MPLTQITNLVPLLQVWYSLNYTKLNDKEQENFIWAIDTLRTVNERAAQELKREARKAESV